MKAILAVVFLFMSAPFLMADDSGLAVGKQAPELIGKNYAGEAFELSTAYQEQPVVLILYRGGWCPFCNVQLQMFEQKLDQFDEAGVKLVAASVDIVDKVKDVVEGQSYGIELGQKGDNNYDLDNLPLSFEIVGELDVDILEAFNAIEQVDPETVEKYLDWGINLEESAGADHHIIAVPATYVIDTQGTIVFADSNRDYKQRTSPDEVLSFLKEFNEEVE